MKITRHLVDARPHVVVQITDGSGDQWAGPYLDGAVVKFEVTVEGDVDTAALRAKAIDHGAVHVYPIVARRPHAALATHTPAAPPTDPADAIMEYASIDPPPAGVDPVAMLRELL